ncbi:MAG TPA: SurA N-terminal domain-containing protein [Patescibacteria group bacterium]|nr:SurA N-terminal domain-containing protein [Patescibacteria group bacterium]
MAKKRVEDQEEQLRQSRKEVLIARQHDRQTRQIRLVIIGIIGLVALVFLIGIINELIIKPDAPVASINDTEISLADWQERVRFQRGQLIIGIEDLAEAFNQDIGQVQQYAGQQISLLEDPPTLGQFVVDELVDEELIRQAAEERGIHVSEDDVQKEIEEAFGFFGGAAPTPLPTATKTPIPTPSLTPIVSEVISGDLATSVPVPSPTSGPTSTPPPTATPISKDSFQETFDETIGQFRDLGIDESIFRDVIRAQLFEERLLEELVREAELSDEALQASFFYLLFDSQEEAEQAQSDIATGDFLAIWNAVKNQPLEAPAEDGSLPATASEVLWRTQEDITSLFGLELSEAVFNKPIDEPSPILIVQAEDSETGTERYFIVMVSGREMRPLNESALNGARQELLQSWLENQRLDGVEIYERWRASVPQRPVLDRRFLLPPTPAPAVPTLEIPAVSETPAAE